MLEAIMGIGIVVLIVVLLLVRHNMPGDPGRY
jgi:hypothetical protein